MDGDRLAGRRRRRLGRARRFGPPEPPRHRDARARLRHGERADPAALRRGPELPEPARWHGGPLPCLLAEPHRGGDGRHANRGRHESSPEPDGDDGAGSGLAGTHHQDRRARGAGLDGQRRVRHQRSGAPPAVRSSRGKGEAAESGEGLRRLVFRAQRPAAAPVVRRRRRAGKHSRPETPGAEVRGGLPVPPRHTLRLPAEMAAVAAVPADERRSRDAGSVGLVGRQDAVSAGPDGAAPHAGFRAPRKFRLPRHRSRTTRRAAPGCRHRGGPHRGHGARPPPRCGHAGAAARHPPSSGDHHPLRVVRWASGERSDSPGVAIRADRPRSRHRDDRQRRRGAGTERFLHPEGRIGRLPHPSGGHAAQGGRRPPSLTRRERGPRPVAEVRPPGVRTPEARPTPGRVRFLPGGGARGSRFAPADLGGSRSGGGMAP